MGLSLKSIGKGLTKVARIAAPVVGFVNPAAGAALGVVGGLGHGKDSLKKMAIGGISGGAGGIAGKLGMGGAAATAGGGAMKSGGIGGALRSVGGYLKNNPDLIMSGIGMVQGARQQGKADEMAKRQLAMAEQRYRDTAPLRSVGMERLLNTQRPDLSELYRTDNAFARPAAPARSLRPLSPTMGGTTPRGPQAEDPAERPLRELTMPRPMRGGRF